MRITAGLSFMCLIIAEQRHRVCTCCCERQVQACAYIITVLVIVVTVLVVIVFILVVLQADCAQGSEPALLLYVGCQTRVAALATRHNYMHPRVGPTQLTSSFL